MPALHSKTRSRLLLPRLEVARSLPSRAWGLLGHASLPEDEGLCIERCSSIHTCFMRFPIDCVFVDRNFKVKAIRADVRPWRFTLPVFGAFAVIELAAGSARRLGLHVGEELHVGA